MHEVLHVMIEREIRTHAMSTSSTEMNSVECDFTLSKLSPLLTLASVSYASLHALAMAGVTASPSTSTTAPKKVVLHNGVLRRHDVQRAVLVCNH
jgi:hypothetical protein